MKILNSVLVVAALLFSVAVSAQEVKFEKKGDLVKGIYYYEDGTISQEGTFKNGKLHGEWVSYDQNGKKTALANYKEGEKDGKWFFWANDILTEVDYTNNIIAEVKSYKNTNAIVNRS